MSSDINIEDLDVEELWLLFSKIRKRLKFLNQIRTNNVTGERGEQLIIAYYNKTKGLAKLQAAPKGTRSIDAISRNGERYSIKTIMFPNKTTGVFYGFGDKDNPKDEKKFEFVIICSINDSYELKAIYELDWKTFFEYKHWHSRMRAYNLNLTTKLISACKVIFINE